MEKSSARSAYQLLAPVYDELTDALDYEQWIGGNLLPQLECRGLERGAVLDIGCGTGRAFDPLLSRGWRIVGCDVSEAMLAEAKRKYPQVPTFIAEARDLPFLGNFDLVLMLGDVLNYLIEDGDLDRVCRGIRANLSKGGLVAFDANTLALLNELFGAGKAERLSANGWNWVGRETEILPGRRFEADVSGTAFPTHVHRQRHWSVDEVQMAMRSAGIVPLAAMGHREVGDLARIVLSDDWDEERDMKVIHIGRAAPDV